MPPLDDETPASLANAMERLFERAGLNHPPHHLTWAEGQDGIDLVYSAPGLAEVVVARIPGRSQGSAGSEWVSISVQQTATLSSGWVVLSVAGEIDLTTTPVLRQRLASTEHLDVAVDLRDVTFLDSTGLGTLIAAHSRAVAHHRRFAVICAGNRIRKLLEVTGMVDVLTNVMSIDELDQASAVSAQSQGQGIV